MSEKAHKYAGMAELADAHGSGPCESNFMQVQVLLPAPKGADLNIVIFFLRRVLAAMFELQIKKNS